MGVFLICSSQPLGNTSEPELKILIDNRNEKLWAVNLKKKKKAEKMNDDLKHLEPG